MWKIGCSKCGLIHWALRYNVVCSRQKSKRYIVPTSPQKKGESLSVTQQMSFIVEFDGRWKHFLINYLIIFCVYGLAVVMSLLFSNTHFQHAWKSANSVCRCTWPIRLPQSREHVEQWHRFMWLYGKAWGVCKFSSGYVLFSFVVVRMCSFNGCAANRWKHKMKNPFSHTKSWAKRYQMPPIPTGSPFFFGRDLFLFAGYRARETAPIFSFVIFAERNVFSVFGTHNDNSIKRKTGLLWGKRALNTPLSIV